jgi:hypothetical protein
MSARRFSTAFGAALALGLCSCPSGLDRPAKGGINLPTNENIGQGFEPGLALTNPINNDAVLCGALIPGVTPAQDLQVAFAIFTTAASATDATGTGVPLVRETPPPLDNNAASDVFVAAVVRSNNPGSTTPNAFTQAILPVMRHPRCLTCHSFHYANGFGSGNQHTGGNSDGTNNGCTNCHSDVAIDPQGLIGPIDWRAPTQAQGDLDFRGKTAQQLYDKVIDNLGQPLQVVQHLKADTRIFWAIELGIVPSNPPANIGDVPITKNDWDALVDAWAAGNFIFDTSGAVKDITLVSKRHDAQFNETGDGASLAPHAVYVPDAGYDPNSTAPQIAGRIHIVFASDTGNLVSPSGATSTKRDIWHATVEVRMNEEPQLGQPDPGKINLLTRQDLLERMSRAPNGAPGLGNSNHPKIACDASRVVFDSEATNLIAGFVNVNGASPDVFIAQPGTNNTTLVSHADGIAARGGNGASGNPSISALSEAVVYETFATDVFTSSPGNGVQNIALAMPPGATATLSSATSAGIPGTGGDCRNPSVFITATPSPLVVFESDMTDLVSGVGAIASTQVYMAVDGVTRLVTRKGAAPGNGASTRPVLSLDGKTVLFQSAASNLDTVRPLDTNGFGDVMRFNVDRLLVNGITQIERISIASDGSDGDGVSSLPMLTNFVRPPLVFDGGTLGVYRTQATNVGNAVNTDVVLVFLTTLTP